MIKSCSIEFCMQKMNYNKFFLFEPSIGSNNIGDSVIVDSIKREMNKFLSKGFCIELPTHLPISNRYMFFLGKADYKFVCGSNIIVGKLNHFLHLKQWMLDITTLYNMKNVILIGVGTQSYNQKINLYTRLAYKYMFNSDFIHSVRDSYTEKKLKEIGVKNVINTACPTMWMLTPEHCRQIPKGKGENAVFTLTDYKPNIQRDICMISTLVKNYNTVYFWPQGYGDMDYFKSLNIKDRIEIVPSTLYDYDSLLKNNDVDFIGTRLHGGMRALQQRKRTIIIGIDNRAIELKKDFNIPVLEQEKIDQLESVLNNDYEICIYLPMDNISKFLSQFDIKY